MRIAKLHDLCKGGDIFVAGTGPSLRCLDLGYLRDKFVIGLNQFYRLAPTNLSLTVHPELIVEADKTKVRCHDHLQWVTKRKPPLNTLDFGDSRHYVFKSSTDLQVVADRPADVLYLGEGIQATAVDLAARMGAKNVVLVGCDACQLGTEFHAHDAHVRWLGQTPAAQYRLYRDHTAAVRQVVREKWGVNVMTLSPFIGLDAAQEDYARLCRELKLEPLPPPEDVSPYRRK